MINTLEMALSTIIASVAFAFLVKLWIQYTEGRKAVETLKEKDDVKKIGDVESKIFNSFDNMSDSDLSKSAGSVDSEFRSRKN